MSKKRTPPKNDLFIKKATSNLAHNNTNGYRRRQQHLSFHSHHSRGDVFMTKLVVSQEAYYVIRHKSFSEAAHFDKFPNFENFSKWVKFWNTLAHYIVAIHIPKSVHNNFVIETF